MRDIAFRFDDKNEGIWNDLLVRTAKIEDRELLRLMIGMYNLQLKDIEEGRRIISVDRNWKPIGEYILVPRNDLPSGVERRNIPKRKPYPRSIKQFFTDFANLVNLGVLTMGLVMLLMGVFRIIDYYPPHWWMVLPPGIFMIYMAVVDFFRRHTSIR